ncbi:MAG: GNAT family N-acetyltransferase [Candidatus Saccharimonadales bacterium]
MNTLSPNQHPLADEAIAQIETLVAEAFGMKPEEPILGITNDVVIAPNLRALLERPSTILSTQEDDNKIIGFNLAIPIGDMNPARATESTETAYIYFTAVDPSRQGEGLVRLLNEDILKRIAESGYSHAEIDTLIANDYAEIFGKNYQSAIIETYDHERWPEIGKERFFRLDLAKLSPSN